MDIICGRHCRGAVLGVGREIGHDVNLTKPQLCGGWRDWVKRVLVSSSLTVQVGALMCESFSETFDLLYFIAWLPFFRF